MISASPEEVQNHIKEIEKDTEILEQQIIDICYFMPSITWDNAWSLSFKQRDKIVKSINQRLKEKAGTKDEYF